MLKRLILDRLSLGRNAAAFGRLCVETREFKQSIGSIMAAAFGRLCVETIITLKSLSSILGSRLRAAVC